MNPRPASYRMARNVAYRRQVAIGEISRWPSCKWKRLSRPAWKASGAFDFNDHPQASSKLGSAAWRKRVKSQLQLCGSGLGVEGESRQTRAVRVWTELSHRRSNRSHCRRCEAIPACDAVTIIGSASVPFAIRDSALTSSGTPTRSCRPNLQQSKTPEWPPERRKASRCKAPPGKSQHRRVPRAAARPR
jgi:hypothetical protein